MTSPQTDIKTQLSELSADAFEAFCDDISGMFGVEMQSELSPGSHETAQTLKRPFKKLSAVITVKSTGILEGNLYIVFDKDALFTLSGTIVMLPEVRILENCKKGTLKEAEELHDAVGETGNLLVGSWDRIFRENLEGHTHFLQTETYIGNPWDDPQKVMGISKEEEFLFFPCEMTVGDFPAFQCGVIYPDVIFQKPSQGSPVSDLQEPEEVSESPESTENAENKESETQKTETSAELTSELAPQEVPQEPEDKKSESQKEDTSEQGATERDGQTSQQVEKGLQSQGTKPQVDDTPPKDSVPEIAHRETAAGAVSQTIQQMVQSMPSPSPEHASAILDLCAKDVMTQQVLWGSPDDSVQHAIEKMQQVDAACMMVGHSGSLEGIVTWMNIAEAVSIYLRPVFAKWHRPVDDATLQIKLKIIMTRPVRTITPQASLSVVMEDMCRHRLRCLPVVNEQGDVQGVVTSSDIFRFFLKTTTDFSVAEGMPRSSEMPAS